MSFETDFLTEDLKQAEEQWNCFEYCTVKADAAFDKGNYGQAQAWYENAARALGELDKMKEAKLKAEREPNITVINYIQYQVPQQHLVDQMFRRHKGHE